MRVQSVEEGNKRGAHALGRRVGQVKTVSISLQTSRQNFHLLRLILKTKVKEANSNVYRTYFYIFIINFLYIKIYYNKRDIRRGRDEKENNI
jgi:hypothetical protein